MSIISIGRIITVQLLEVEDLQLRRINLFHGVREGKISPQHHIQRDNRMLLNSDHQLKGIIHRQLRETNPCVREYGEISVLSIDESF